MDRKHLILLEPRNLLLTSKKDNSLKAIAERMCAASPQTLGKYGPEKVKSLVFQENSDFCAYSSAQAMRKMAENFSINPANMKEFWADVVAAYVIATKDVELNTGLVDLLHSYNGRPDLMVGIMANAFWFSTPDMKAALPEGLFDLFFQSGDLRCRKPWAQLYELVENITSLPGSNILLLDGSYENIIEARNHDWAAELVDASMPVGTIDAILSQFLGVTNADITVAAPAEQDQPPAIEDEAPEEAAPKTESKTDEKPTDAATAPQTATIPGPITMGKSSDATVKSTTFDKK